MRLETRGLFGPRWVRQPMVTCRRPGPGLDTSLAGCEPLVSTLCSAHGLSQADAATVTCGQVQWAFIMSWLPRV